MLTKKMRAAIETLVCAFDSDDGLSEEVYASTRDLLDECLGVQAGAIFTQYINATDGEFYIRTPTTGPELCRMLFDASTKT